jgi:hypothetical protein
VEASVTDAAERAVETINKWASLDWSLRADFDETMSERLPETMLASAWASVTANFGDLNGLGEPTVRTVDEHTVVDIPAKFERGEMKARVAFDPSGKIAGLFILNPSVL